MEILSRVNSNTIEKDLYQKFLRNDPELAKQYAFDTVAHSKNKSTLDYSYLDYDILGTAISLSEIKENLFIEVTSDYPLDIRLDKILSYQLGISREQVKKLSNSGKLYAEGIKDISKAKLKCKVLLIISD